jgi:eukaryotic-like serine/threonine-protein kinase
MLDDPPTCECCGAALPQQFFGRTCEACQVAAPIRPARSNGNGSELPPDDVPPISGHCIFEPIAQGGMSTIHRARQESLQRDVAVKIVDTSRDYEASLDRFAREVRVLARLDHPNIVPIYDYGTDSDGRRAYTMKLVRGRTLEEILSNTREGIERNTLQQLLRIFRKVCDAVAFAHSRGVIHRDLKPANIMVGAFGEVLVVDWGLAADLSEVAEGRTALPFEALAPDATPSGDACEDSGLTVYGEVLGTLEYMPPEQAFGTTRVDGRADVYSLGGILYAILTLRAPLSRSSYKETLEDVRQGRIDPFGPDASLPPEHPHLWRVPQALLAVVRKAMARDREERFSTVADLAADVDAYLAGFATSAEQITLAGQLWLLIKRHRGLSAAALVLLAITAGFIAQLIASEQRASGSEKSAKLNESAAR